MCTSITSDADGLFVQDVGHGPVVVLIPGLGGLARFWTSFQERLATRFRTLAIDHPGMGASPTRGAQSIEAVVQAVCDMLDRKGLAQAHVIGHSTGGLVAQALALDHPARLRGVVLSSTWARTDRRFRALFALRKQVLRDAGPEAYTLLGDMLAYPPSWYEAHLAGRCAPAAGQSALRVNAALTLERIDMLLGYQRYGQLPQLQKQVLVVGARDDGITPFNHSVELATRIPGATLREVSGGHFAPITNPHAYAEAVAEFLENTP